MSIFISIIICICTIISFYSINRCIKFIIAFINGTNRLTRLIANLTTDNNTSHLSWYLLFFYHNIWITKLLQKSEMRKDIVIELSYKGFS